MGFDLASGLTGAGAGAAAGPGGAAVGFLSGLFGSSDESMGPITPGVVNPETGKGVRCGKPDETERVLQMQRGDYGWILARMGGRNYYDRPEIIPFPKGTTPDEIGANIMKALMQTDRPGQCPDMTRIAADRFAVHMRNVQAAPSSTLADAINRKQSLSGPSNLSSLFSPALTTQAAGIGGVKLSDWGGGGMALIVIGVILYLALKK